MSSCNTATYKRLKRVLCRQCSYTAHTAKQRAGLYRCVSGNLTHSTAHDTRPTQADITPLAPRWSASQRRSTSSAYQIPDAAPDAVQGGKTAYYNKVYKRADHASGGGSARRLEVWHRVSGQSAPGQLGTLHPAGQSNGRAHGGRRGTTGGLSPHLFSGFRPIANKGQQ